MEFAQAVVAWLTDLQHYSGSDGIPNRVLEHIVISAVTTAAAVALALPFGILAGHTRRGGFVAVNIANLGRAMPSLALLALMFPLALSLKLGFGFWPTFLALVPLGIPPVLTNSYVAVREVDPDIVEAARGMGLREQQVLRQVELPIAAPLIIAGVRNAAVAIVATATLGALVAGGGLGRYIVDGIARQDYPRVFVGALLVALLSISVEIAFGIFERLSVSAGLRGAEATAALEIQERPR
ncbi:MAG: ABC transporter permease subunit [Chloroflexi bacterium]|nr:ABC transporter permease subunit [Chloroflexota bacterium]MBV9893744.1 ABC transporter permease subunit [Chloroflexota bacterium]